MLAAGVIVGFLSSLPWLQAGTAADVEAVLRLESVWNDAHVDGDAEALGHLWADDLVIVVPGMNPISKAEALSFFRSGRFGFESYRSTETVCRIHGDTAIVNGRITRVRLIGERRLEDDWRFTKVYVRSGLDWQVVSFHASESGQESPR